MKAIQTLMTVCEWLGGSRDDLPAEMPMARWRLVKWLNSPWGRGLWWGFLAGAILLFCGQTSKFIYIDF